MKKKDIYDFLKGLLPDKIRIVLSIVKRQIQNIAESVLLVRGWYWKRHNRIKSNESVSVCFVTVEPQTWNSLKPVYDAMKKDDRFNPVIITVPNKDGVKEMKHFLEEANYEMIDAFENENVLDIRTFSPDIIFIQTPYDWMYPIQYRMRNLVRIARIFYIPYGYGLSKEEHFKIGYSKHFLANISCIFASNMFEYEFCKKKVSDSIFTKNIKVYDVGYPRFDICKNVIEIQRNDRLKLKKKLTFTWLPRWSFDKNQSNKSSFLKYYNVIVDYFKAHSNLRLIVRPHPMMFENIIKNGLLSDEKINKIKEELKYSENMELDEKKDYYETFLETDVLISDFSSLLAEFYFMEKPVLYCGEYAGCNSIADDMLKEFIRIDSDDKLIYYLNELQDRDFYDKKRCKVNGIMKNSNSDASKKIAEVCFDEVRGY